VSITGIGYEGLTLDAFISKLRVRGVQTLVDVRLNAISRKKGFSKRAFSDALAESGIGYVHMPALGNQRDNRAGYSELNSTAAHDVRARYIDTLASKAAVSALEEVAELARAGCVVVFCYEQDERHCHREQVIAEVTRLLRHNLVEA
jgi:uncharacterized protein (DUF488 family)